mmetsp:Transcript_14499/g.35503  ORF Transcript_14499/g.35503 Transcript_14499/m.35503 type:complete len:243 (-) Transcript_14499:233-961(-)|eukprot:CAMPEP_0206234478 /NCGR_PEP_ID=MMETSP0047_2-20121206/12615_1 /ASSEMBLY_ACC=CAM_ASM_000192 /TAXON_ID=195065 /ORGANISM="Chroomonas mesostigmatica_cf, Strain CCMP1168" /LENGTH=242 /DNA_ID=CAMNT_0053658573 /DNA_START=112 /DNA_END=840 /DNA_ORIENTATION=-
MGELLAMNAQWVRYAARVDGRDKLARSIAYGSEFILWLMSMSGQDALKAWMKQIVKMKTAVGIARKCFRVGAPLKDVDAVMNMKETGTPATMKTLMHCFNSVYYTLDTVELLSIFEFLPYNPPQVKKLRYRFWVFKTILNISLCFMALRKAADAVRALQEKLQKGGDAAQIAEELKVKKAALSKCQAACFIALTDVPVAFFQVTEWGKRNIGAHGMGLSGAIGSLVAARQIWLDCAAKRKQA